MRKNLWRRMAIKGRIDCDEESVYFMGADYGEVMCLDLGIFEGFIRGI